MTTPTPNPPARDWGAELAAKYLPGVPKSVTDLVYEEAEDISFVGGAGSHEDAYIRLASIVEAAIASTYERQQGALGD